jgi:hypothetical protein
MIMEIAEGNFRKTHSPVVKSTTRPSTILLVPYLRLSFFPSSILDYQTVFLEQESRRCKALAAPALEMLQKSPHKIVHST